MLVGRRGCLCRYRLSNATSTALAKLLADSVMCHAAMSGHAWPHPHFHWSIATRMLLQ